MDTFWDRVERLRIKSKLSRPQLANHIDVKVNTFQDWIKKSTYPRVDQAQRIADIFEVTVDYLMTGRTNKPINNPNISKICEKLGALSSADLGFAMGLLSNIESNPMRPDQFTIQENDKNKKASRH